MSNGLYVYFFGGFNTREMLQNIALNVILAEYKDLETSTAAFNLSVQNFNSSQTLSNLSDMQTKWKAARAQLKLIEAIQTGPFVTGGYASNLNTWPTDTATLNSTITANPPYTISSYAASIKGFPAAEYLIFDDGTGSSTTSTVVTDQNLIRVSITGNNRLSYLVSLAAYLASQTTALRESWDPNNGNYAAQMTNTGVNMKYQTVTQITDDLSSQLVNGAEYIQDIQIGIPSGLTSRTNGVKDLTKVESKYSDNSVADMQNFLKGIQNIYMGSYTSRIGTGFNDFVSYINPNSDKLTQSQISDLLTKINRISPTLKSAITSSNSSVSDAFNSAKTLKSTLSTSLSATAGSSGGAAGDGD